MTMTFQDPGLFVVTAASESRPERLLRNTSRSEMPRDMPASVADEKVSGIHGAPIKEIAARVGLYAAVLAICVYSFFPIYWMILSSLRAPQKLFLDSSLVFWPPDLS